MKDKFGKFVSNSRIEIHGFHILHSENISYYFSHILQFLSNPRVANFQGLCGLNLRCIKAINKIQIQIPESLVMICLVHANFGSFWKFILVLSMASLS